MLTVEIKYMKFTNKYGRLIALCQMVDESGKILLDGTLAQVMELINRENYKISNAQYVLDCLVRLNGFAA